MPALIRIERPQPAEFAPYYARYIDKVPGDDAFEALASQIDETAALLRNVTEAQGLHRYAPGKWSVKESILHLADGERVFAYRALRFARNDRTELPGFEENEWVPESGADARPVADLVAELRAVRAATVAMFAGFEPAALARIGTANGSPMSPRALAWSIAGHELHHCGLLRERYGIGS